MDIIIWACLSIATNFCEVKRETISNYELTPIGCMKETQIYLVKYKNEYEKMGLNVIVNRVKCLPTTQE